MKEATMLTPDAPAPSADIVVVTKDDCPYCSRAKTMLDRVGVPYKTVVVNEASARQAIYDEYHLEGPSRTMPQIIVNGERIGGYHDLITFVTGGGFA